MLKLEYAKPIAHAKYIIPLAGLMNGVLIGALLWMPMAGGHGGARVFEVFKWGSLSAWRTPVLCAKVTILVLAAGTVIMTRRGSVILGCIGCSGVLITWAMFMLRIGRWGLLDTSATLLAAVIARLVLVWVVASQPPTIGTARSSWRLGCGAVDYVMVLFVLVASVLCATFLWRAPAMSESFKN